MKNQILVSSISVLFFLSSCVNSTTSRLVDDLKQENDSLKQVISQTPCLNSIVSDPYPSLGVAYSAVNAFQSLNANDKILIPVAVTFDAEDFMTEMCKGDVKFFRFYPVIDPKDADKKLHLAMVPVNSQNVDLLGEENAPRVYNFAKNCPDDCATQTSYHASNTYMSFKKQ